MVSGGGEWQTKFNVSPGPGLWPLVLGPYGPDLVPDLDLTWDLDLDLSLTISNSNSKLRGMSLSTTGLVFLVSKLF